ncbi:MerR family transcriptional regulator [Nocardia higoensis]|uniref:MerR family transcriptional regulator n=1 Tax=Nocardia higoensis TaxID=228599 RepID=UPI0002DA6F6E|nr:MerR family transcriptional regulator [Nocardia higoensis]
MRIGDAAAALGVEAHVLRHWESVGLLTPPRSPSGHRSYDENVLDSARLIQILQRAGLSLDEMRRLGHSAHEGRLALIAAHRAQVRDRIALLQATDQFLEHLTACRHPVIAECPECSDFTKRGKRAARLNSRIGESPA